jgi:hypothetical protein
MAGPADPHGADAARAMAAQLTAPLAAGADQRVLPVAATGEVTVAFPTRRPLLTLALRRPLDARELRVTATLPAGAGSAVLAFAPWSDAGTALPLHRPAAELAAPFTVSLASTLGGVALPEAELPSWLEAVLSQGELGRLLAVLGAEKARIRREARQLLAMRRLGQAGGDALDRLGADLGVPRLDSRPAWDVLRNEIAAVPGIEDDAAYRHRLGIYRPFIAPTRAAATELLRRGVPEATLAEPGNPLAVSVRLVAIGPATPRTEMLARLRADWLVHPPIAADGVHAARFLPKPRRDAIAAMRVRLRNAFDFPANAALAPGLAAAMDSAAKILAAIGHTARITVSRTQDAAGGSRFETGLGLAIAPPAVAEADAIRTLLLATRQPGSDREVEALIAAARAVAPPAGDVTLDWLWDAAGLRTRHRLSTGALYLSDMPVRGLVIEGPESVAPGAAIEFRAVFEAPGNPAMNAALGDALARAMAGRTAAGAPAFTVLAPTDATARRATAQNILAAGGVANTLAATGLAAPITAAPVIAALAALPDELHRTLALDATLGAQIRASDAAAIPPLSALVALLRGAGVTSLLPLVTPAEVLLVAGVTPLPVVGVNLGERRATGIRWGIVPLDGTAMLSGLGARTIVTGGQAGLVALVALGHLRDGSPDPYEIRCDLPAGRVLELADYEWLMNALERCFPLGVEVNTWQLRRAHVDLDGDGVADPLPPNLARLYRRFRNPRLRGLDEPG